MLLYFLFLSTMMTMALSAAVDYSASGRVPSDDSAASRFTTDDSYVPSHRTAEPYSVSTDVAVESSSKSPSVEVKLAELQKEIQSLSAAVKELNNENADNIQLIIRNANYNVEKLATIIQNNINNLEDNLYNNTDILRRILQALDRPEEKFVTSHDSSTRESDTFSNSEPPQPSSSEAIPTSSTTEEPLPDIDCADLYSKGKQANGKYIITPFKDQESFEVYCDMTTDGGGWTVIQRRGAYGNGREYFYRTWDEYKKGFGNVTNEFWLGNERLFSLTQQKPQLLRVDLWDNRENQAHAKYSEFKVESEQRLYRLQVSGYSGTAGNSLFYSNGAPFTTKDRDNDQDSGYNCAVTHQGAWWYKSCTYSNLNGLNLGGFSDSAKGIWWFHWKASYASITSAEMKIRPANF